MEQHADDRGLSHPYPSDNWRVLTLLKSIKGTIHPDSVEVVYSTPRDYFEVNTIYTLKQTDALLFMLLEEVVSVRIEMSRFKTATTPVALTHDAGLAGDEAAVGKYLTIEVSENVQNETVDVITQELVMVYYTAADPDRTGDGDGNDPGDINENSLILYWLNESSGRWTPLSEAMDWMFGNGSRYHQH